MGEIKEFVIRNKLAIIKFISNVWTHAIQIINDIWISFHSYGRWEPEMQLTKCRKFTLKAVACCRRRIDSKLKPTRKREASIFQPQRASTPRRNSFPVVFHFRCFCNFNFLSRCSSFFRFTALMYTRNLFQLLSRIFYFLFCSTKVFLSLIYFVVFQLISVYC